MEIIEVINEFEDIPLEDRECMKETFSKALKKVGMDDKDISEEIKYWLKGKDNPAFTEDWSEEDELMNMYGANSEEELNDLMETNNIFRD